jgi:hypothetical protein
MSPGVDGIGRYCRLVGSVDKEHEIAASRGGLRFGSGKAEVGTATAQLQVTPPLGSRPWSIRQVTAPDRSKWKQAPLNEGQSLVFISSTNTSTACLIHRLLPPSTSHRDLRHPPCNIFCFRKQHSASQLTHLLAETNKMDRIKEVSCCLRVAFGTSRPLFGPTIGFTRTFPEATTSIACPVLKRCPSSQRGTAILCHARHDASDD